MKKRCKKLLIRLAAILCSAVLLFLSPCARYIGASNIENVQATEWVLVEGGASVIEWLMAFLTSLGLYASVRENRAAIADSFKEYMQARIDTDMFIIHSTEDTCIQVYNKVSNTIQNISWQELTDSLAEYHDTAVDNLTGLYVKYCPQLLNGINDYIADVLDGDVYVSGLSDAIIDYTPVTADDIVAQWSGEPFNYTCSFSMRENLTNHTYYYFEFVDSYTLNYPLAAYIDSSSGQSTLLFYALKPYGLVYREYIRYNLQVINNNKITRQVNNGSANGFCWGYEMAYSANFPVFATETEMVNYLYGTGSVTNALNYDQSMYCDISDIADIPRFYRTWQQEELERLNNTSHIGIGSYGRGTTADKWDYETAWIRLASLHQYTLSLLDIYNQMIHDIRNGTYDSSEDIPNTYSDAWEQTISGAWNDVVEQSSEAGPADGSKDDTNGEDSDKDKDKDKDEPDAPIEGEGTEKPGEGGGSDTDPPTEGEDPDPKEPPEGNRFTEEEIQEILNDIKGDGFKNNPLRQAYENEVHALKGLGEELLAGGMSLEEVARTLWQARRDLGIQYKDMTPELLREYIYEINLERYGDKLGPSFEYFIDKLGKSFEDIIDSASRPNSDIDKLLEGFEEWLRRQ